MCSACVVGICQQEEEKEQAKRESDSQRRKHNCLVLVPWKLAAVDRSSDSDACTIQTHTYPLTHS